jgi:hypothetical protein
MKKLLLLLVSLLLLFSLCACPAPRESYTVKEGWRTFKVDPEACTISFKTDTYKYDISGNGLEYEITITYPDGSVYCEGRKETFPVDYRLKGRSKSGPETYISGDILCKVLEYEIPTPDWENLGSKNVVSISQTGHGAVCVFEPFEFYEDEYGIYYFNRYGSPITVTYLDGTTENVISAFNAGRVTLIDLQKFGINYGLDPISDYWPISDKD